ncbi:hypothetical protein [Pyxidicoccus fallax]|uniref:hypothetical protein n=1 Tax=Pyxidicoccus fallax TaxID=394095 RepID=UPI00248465E7|nr:hypothetical protein [Pyxidicoccus fallax]
MRHEGLLLLFRNRPALAAELLRDALGIGLPAWSEARVESAELTEVVPTEYRADLVVLLWEGRPVFAIVVEVQLSRDEDKHKTWPLYLSSLRSRVDCPTALLVVAPDAAVARWCARPIELGHPGFVLRPLVVGPDAIPVLTDVQEARREPELAVLSAMAHGQGEVGQAIAQAVMGAVVGLEGERVRLYVDLVVSSLNEAARHALEELMRSGTYEYQSEFARRYVAQGRQEGLQEGEKVALLEVLDARGLKVDAEARQRIQECTRPAQLKRWLRRAVVVQSVQELFARAPAARSAPRSVKKRGGTKSPRGA